jgi:NAD(P)-dependent dehydrogenase (short-subunit alcohol dehydrogenase family)
MEITGSVALVTGANRGLGRRFAQALLDRGAAKVYAAARNPESIDLPGVIALPLDITDPTSVAAAAAAAGDVTLLINNAGSSTHANLLDSDVADIRLEMDTHFFGTLSVTRAFAPILATNGGGAILNVLSVLSWLTVPAAGGYAAAKSAEWSLTNAVREQVAPAGTLVTALHVGYMDTDMAGHVDGPKLDPAAVANQALDGVEAGDFEVLADDLSRNIKTALAGPLTGIYRSLTPVATH